MTILVVEDDPSILTLVDRLLTSRGHTVLAASDTIQASAALRDHRGAPDMLLNDLVLAAGTCRFPQPAHRPKAGQHQQHIEPEPDIAERYPYVTPPPLTAMPALYQGSV